ncbi:glycosyltransferase family 4 protein [Mucilaginibacter corticis]|uniref:Glycosyltransferase family 4 protein n=1 Tax=Mucilaginibacter corticis TaxID=2597670 RepID=A0A556MK69_9SPHI|nr:glycosyltransferase family 4 protein [Mucilaginibacter corticis]TSJ40304.1 glycosyltransferase family 4 protein [Mucilaginibacter corticis]
MKFFLISNMYPSNDDPYYGSFVKEFYDGFCRKGYDLKTSALIKGRTSNPIHKLWKYIRFNFEILFKGIFCKYDIIYVHTVSHTAIPLLILRLFKKYKLIANPHGGDIITINPFEERMQGFVKKLIDIAQLIVVPSNFFKGYITDKFNIDENKIFVSASGGIDIQQFNSISCTTTSNNDNIFKIGYVSRIDTGKGWDILINSIHELVNQHKIKNIECIIVGNGNEVSDMRTLITQLNLKNIVHYIGPKTRQELPLVYANFDIFVFPTLLTESLGLVGLEAMACGVPVIGSKLGGITDYLIDEYNGYFFEPGNVVDLTNALFKFYQLDNSKKKVLKQNTRNTALDYDNKKIISDLAHKIEIEFTS